MNLEKIKRIMLTWLTLSLLFVKQCQFYSTVRQYGTFELRIRSEFYCSNDVIVGHISLPHYKETVKSMFISCLLYIVLSPSVKGIFCIKGIVKFLHTKTHFDDFFLKC